MHIFIAVCAFLIGLPLNGMHATWQALHAHAQEQGSLVTPITINPVAAPQAYFNELDNRIENEAIGVKNACTQRNLASIIHHLKQLSVYLTQAEERHADFTKAYQDKQKTQKRTLDEIVPEPEMPADIECLNRIIEFNLQTVKFIQLFEDYSQEDLTPQNWHEVTALLKSSNPANTGKRSRIDTSN